MSDSPSEPRAKRQKIDKTGRFAAFEKLKQLKGKKYKCEVEEQVDNVYELVDEREYAKKAKDLYGDTWIEDDGTGYVEDGRDFFEDEDNYASDEEPGSSKHLKTKGGKKRARENEKGIKSKNSIRSLFSNAVPKKVAAVSIKDDDILADILGELQDNTPEKGNSITEAKRTKVITPARIISNSSKKINDAAAKEYMNSFMNNIKVKQTERISSSEDKLGNDKNDHKQLDCITKGKLTEPLKAVNVSPIEATKPAKNSIENVIQTEIKDNSSPIIGSKPEIPDDDFDISCLQDDTNQFELEKVIPTEKLPQEVSQEKLANTTSVANEAENMQKLLSNWENICQTDDFEDELINAPSNAFGDDESELRFWYWEAWEDAVRRPGEVFLFGRTIDGKSICVRIEKITRVLYLLPREYLLDPISKEPTKQKVTLADLYKEFDETIATDLKLTEFRSRKVTKNFGYHSIGIDVPQQCDYMEVHYDGKKSIPNLKRKYNSIAHIFGANTTSLERFLLDRKIKGPCWLKLKQYNVNPAPMSWCKTDISVAEPKYVLLVEDTKVTPPPPLTLLALNVRTVVNPKSLKNEICMISMLVHNRFHIDKKAPQPAFNRHMCGFTRPAICNWPFDLNAKLSKFTATKVFKHDSERAMLSWFLAQYQQIDADLLVTHDAMDCQFDVIADRIVSLKIPQWSRLGRLRMTMAFGKKMLDFYIGRMVCDVKRSAEECIRSRSYDLQTLCQNVLKIKETERLDITQEDLLDMYETGDGILKLITLTMQDNSFILRLMYDLNIMPLALQITNICGNIMTRTLQSGRSERNEYLLLHAFTEKNYIVPDKRKRDYASTGESNNTTTLDDVGDNNDGTVTTAAASAGRRKAAYSGGLVLDPIRGLYDKYILLMDFNSLYPSIIQEYNICFTTVQQPYNLDDLPELPSTEMEPGILPLQLKRLVESRREVKKLLTNTDLSADLKLQYHIRQMALKLTANSMYGCLGFAHSRFFAQHLAALVTHKGREILMNTKSLVQKMNYEVVYGDTDSIMVNTNIIDYDQVFKIGHTIKQNVNKLYKQLELDIDGVFSCLLLLRKKKYAAVKVSKTIKGELKKEQEHKGLDIVRRDWSQIAIMVGKVVLDEVLSDKSLDDKLEAIHSHLEKVRDQIINGEVPLPMFLITKQLSKAPADFNHTSSQSHVQVALRMNSTRNRRYKKGDMVDYVICDDGTTNPATQRAYHLDEVKSSETLKLDNNYYLAHQIHPVVTRMIDVLEGTDAGRIAECLGLDASKFKSHIQKLQQERVEEIQIEVTKNNLQKFRSCEKFTFICINCKTENLMASAFKPAGGNSYEPALQTCSNSECKHAPYHQVIAIRNQLILNMRKYITRFYQNWLVCDDPACNQNTRSYTHVMSGNRPVCMRCKNGSLVRQYGEADLHLQLKYLQYTFDLTTKPSKINTLEPELIAAYQLLLDAVNRQLEKTAYGEINLGRLLLPTKPYMKIGENFHKKIDLHVPIAVHLDDN
uniref:DNA polymerase n=1 Tax=Glossina brevipalpis TaxID=37001 RepID=A0A1A9W2C3_9MUSC